MRNLVFFMHASLDGFVGGPQGQLDWISVNDEIFDFAATMTDAADTALYGRVTYNMMESYWPTAGDKPNASKHDKEHAVWYNAVSKIVLSTTITAEGRKNTTVISDNITDAIQEIKAQEGKNILIFGSPSASHTLLNLGLIDEIWVFVYPVIIGSGIPLFKDIQKKTALELVESKVFSNGGIALHYRIIK